METVSKVFYALIAVLVIAAIIIYFVDPSILSQLGSTGVIAVASAFIALLALATAYFTFVLISKQTNFIKKQTAILQEQALIWRNRDNPALQFENLQFLGNNISLDIKNVGKETAYWLGILVDYYPLKVIKWEGKDDLSIDDKKMRLVDQDRKVIGNIRYVNFLSHITKKIITLKPKSSTSFNFEPHFGFKPITKSKAPWIIPVSKTPEETVKVLEQNGVPYVLIRFYLVCKNLIETAQDEKEIDEFIFVIGKHKTLEDAYKEHFRMSLRPIPISEFELMEGMWYEEYKYKSGKNANPYEDPKPF